MRICANKVVAGVRSSTLLLNIRPVDTRQLRSVQDFDQLEVLAVAIPWGFESPLPHHSIRPLRGLPRGSPAYMGTASGALSERSGPDFWRSAQASPAREEKTSEKKDVTVLTRLTNSQGDSNTMKNELGLLWIPVGFLLMIGVVAALFLTVLPS